MGRPSNFPTTVEDCLCLSLKDLRKWGYLKPESYYTGTVKHSRNGMETASYSIAVLISSEESYLQLDYTINRGNETKKEISYRVPLVTSPTNIGNGQCYYLECPHTGKRCFKLYKPSQEDYFLHRSAFSYLIYEKQCESKKLRTYEKSSYGKALKLERMSKELIWDAPKYHRNYYRGIPTKRMQKYLRLQREVAQFSQEQILTDLYDYLR